MVDQTNAILKKSLNAIEKSLEKVSKKKFKDDPEVLLQSDFSCFKHIYQLEVFLSVEKHQQYL